MAKKRDKKHHKKHGTGRWQGTPDDAIKLAAIRWYLCAIEIEAIQLYATDPSLYESIEEKMGDCIDELHGLKKTLTGDEGDCPPGYVMCGDECAPRCFTEEND